MSVSEDELAALIASLGAPAPAAPAQQPAPEPGGWIAATQAGLCSSCRKPYDLFAQIKADGRGGWISDCCGPVAPPRPVPPLPPAGPPPSTITELRQVLMDFEASRPRTMQRNLGPSELGTPCQQQIARKLVGAPRRPVTEPTWAPFQGTAVHASMESVVSWWNKQLGRTRWIAEDKLYIDDGQQATADAPVIPAITGHGDAFDLDNDMVIDWKHVGKTALEKLARGKRMGKPTAEQVSQEYRIQAHLYGLGHSRKGRTVRWVRLVLLARSWSYDESQEWTEPYDENVAFAAVHRYYATHDLIRDLAVDMLPDLIAQVPAAATRDACHFCPFLRPGQPSDWNGCPGDKPLDQIVERATAGLIAPTQGDTQ